MVPGCFSQCQNVFYGFSRFQVGVFGSRMFIMVFKGSRLVYHGFRWVLLVIQGFRVVFHGSRWVLWFFKVPGGFFYCSRSVFMATGLVFMIPDGFSSFINGPRLV